MSTEELLRPRFKVIADYPYSEYKVGAIINVAEHNPYPLQHLNKYPHIFERLEWWEERKDDDMPKYVRCIVDGGSYDLPKNGVGKAFRWRERHADVFVDYKDNCCQTEDFIPATEGEYNDYYLNEKQAR